jgi:hypothetical protein
MQHILERAGDVDTKMDTRESSMTTCTDVAASNDDANKRRTTPPYVQQYAAGDTATQPTPPQLTPLTLSSRMNTGTNALYVIGWGVHSTQCIAV